MLNLNVNVKNINYNLPIINTPRIVLVAGTGFISARYFAMDQKENSPKKPLDLLRGFLCGVLY